MKSKITELEKTRIECFCLCLVDIDYNFIDY